MVFLTLTHSFLKFLTFSHFFYNRLMDRNTNNDGILQVVVHPHDSITFIFHLSWNGVLLMIAPFKTPHDLWRSTLPRLTASVCLHFFVLPIHKGEARSAPQQGLCPYGINDFWLLRASVVSRMIRYLC